jgi:hypothetical protein
MTMVNNVIEVVNYVIAVHPSLRNFMIADTVAWLARGSITVRDLSLVLVSAAGMSGGREMGVAARHAGMSLGLEPVH